MLPKITVALLLLGACTAFKPVQETAKPTTGDDDDEAAYLLSGDVTPIAYDLVLTTHIEKFDLENSDSFNFEGEVIITVNVAKATKTIELHANQLTIQSVVLDEATAKQELDFSVHDETTHKQQLSTKDGTDIAVGDHTIKITYTGKHGDDMHGFYRSYYTNEDNEMKWLVTTQFEAYDARRAFPCFDEPKFKAAYTITIKVSKDLVDNEKYSVLSNMPLEAPGTEETGTNMMIYKFQKSAKKISSYLVAFIISDFIPTAPAPFEETKEFKTWGQKRFINNDEAVVSQAAGPLALATMQILTGVAFGYPKVDQIGIPDFSAGAMENWGLVTYRERLIFYNADKNPTSQKQSVVTVTTHELAHQWFGDLVTLWWWSDIWLNEGFATYFEYHATAQYEMAKDWNMIGQMVVNELQAGAFATDAQPNSRPLTKPVYRPGDIDANFDNVAYSKGGSVIRMWMHIMGEEKFYAALKSYLEAKQEKNATPEELLLAFEDQVPDADYKPTEDFKNWHVQAGYPVVTVAISEEQDGIATLTQERYLVSAPSEEPEKPLQWTIPITHTTEREADFKNTTPEAFLKQDASSLDIQINPKATWTVFNIQQTGFYRVNYDEAGWTALIDQLNKDHTIIHEINRAQILDDAFWLARSTYRNYTAYETALKLSLYLVKEESLIPWTAALNGFSYLYGKLATDDVAGPLLKEHVKQLVAKPFSKLTLEVKEDDSHTNKLLRSQIAAWACKLGIKECVDGALAKGLDTTKSHPDVRTTVLCTVVRNDDSQWATVWEIYKNTTDNAEQTLLLSALGCSNDNETINTFLSYTLDGSGSIRKQDLVSAFSSVYNGNPENVQLALDFVKTNFIKIANTYGGMDPLGGIMIGLAGKLGSEEERNTLIAINEEIQKSTDTNVQAARVSSTGAVDIVTSNYNWLKVKKSSISNWLKTASDENGGGGAATMSATAILLIVPVLMTFVFGQ